MAAFDPKRTCIGAAEMHMKSIGQLLASIAIACSVIPAIAQSSGGECFGYAGPSGACYAGPGGGLYAGPGGGLYAGPGGGLYAGPGGGIYSGPPTNDSDSYKGPWGPCITGAATRQWLKANCPNR